MPLRDPASAPRTAAAALSRPASAAPAQAARCPCAPLTARPANSSRARVAPSLPGARAPLAPSLSCLPAGPGFVLAVSARPGAGPPSSARVATDKGRTRRVKGMGTAEKRGL